MFSYFSFLYIYDKTKRYVGDKVHSILERDYFRDIRNSISEKTVKLATNEDYAQEEHIKRLLKERQKRIDDELRPMNEIRKAKEDFRFRMYRTIARKREREKDRDKNHDLDRS